MKTYNCPQCGNELPLQFRHSKLTVCSHCGSTILLEDNAVRFAGHAAALADLPSLLQMHIPFTYHNHTYTPVGLVRYRFQYGTWDEWWVVDNQHKGVWLSVDEGDYAFERPYKWLGNYPDIRDLKLGMELKQSQKIWQITEKELALCIGTRGELPEAILAGDRMGYVHLSAENQSIITLEYPLKSQDLPIAYSGHWLDPFEIKVAV
jgi:DNA-directed RNA polymerase subunit RPC12/RpoP